LAAIAFTLTLLAVPTPETSPTESYIQCVWEADTRAISSSSWRKPGEGKVLPSRTYEPQPHPAVIAALQLLASLWCLVAFSPPVEPE